MRLLSFLVFLFVIVLELNSTNIWVHGQCLNDQRTLLLQLNQSLTSRLLSFISVPSKRGSWLSDTDCCRVWDGVACDTSGHVTSLDLSSEFISGGLNSTSSLFELQFLESLNLAFNSFSFATIPSGFGRLANLTYLNLSNSGFGGQIPIELSRMTRLVALDLSTFQPRNTSFALKNPDLGTLIRNLKELRVLSLDGVNISAHGGEWCKVVSSSLPKLQVLSLSNCYLSGPFDKSLLQLQSLYELRLNQNNISAKVPEFFSEFRNLSSLHLSTCGLYGKFPERVLQLQTLRSLYVSDNKLLQGSLPEFSEGELLQDLVLSDTKFTGELPHSIGNLALLSRLALDNCSFNGSIPTSISNLSQLQYLDLSMNQFTGSIPPTGWSESLIDIDLSYNQLTGSIPSQWIRLSKLINLNLKNNSFNGTIPRALFTLPSLRKLELAINQFTGSLDELSNGSSFLLETLDLSINKLQGPIPVSFFDLSRLKILTLSSNNFSGTISLENFFQKFKNLSSLDLSSNRLSTTITGDNFTSFPQVGTLKLQSCSLSIFPAFLRNQSGLIYLDLSDNQMHGKIPDWIHMIGAGNLVHLNLSYNHLEDPEKPLLANSFRSLAVLVLRSNLLQGKNLILPSSASVLDYSLNRFTSMIPNISSYLSVAILFSLESNQLTGEIPLSVCEAGYLQVLDLSHNNLSGKIPSCLVSIASLGVLNLRGNNFNGIIPEPFPQNCTLETLDLNENQFEGQLPRSLANCTKLEVLDLGNNQIAGDFPSWLGSLPNLRVLVLRSNRFHGPLVNPAAPDFGKLQIVDISSNNFTGTLSGECFLSWTGMMNDTDEEQSSHKHKILGFKVLQLTHLYYQDTVMVTIKGLDMELVKILTVFTCIDLSNNKFEGDIPDTIGNLSSLYVLNFSRNALAGPIPSTIGKLTQLESLDLSQNKLTGEIPYQLAQLSFLSVLNLSFNKLVGRIPSGSQLQTFQENSFEGNDGLCGFPLPNVCRNITYMAQNFVYSKGDLDWQFILTGLGFGAGVGLILGPLLFWKKGRQWYNEHLHTILSQILPERLHHKFCDNGRIDGEESMEEELTGMSALYYDDDEEEDYDGEFNGYYCVFCTKLDITGRKVIYDPSCNCHKSPPNSS